MSSKNPTKISIFGVTGSIGKSTVDVIMGAPDLYHVYTVTAHKNVDGLAQAARQLGAKKAIIADETKSDALATALAGTDISVQAGQNAIEAAAREDIDLMIAAIMGFAGLRPLMNALEEGINVAIANKEPLVAAGPNIMAMAKKTGAKILPIDSEHNAIFQVFEEKNRAAIDKIILTASGGPFLTWDEKDIHTATPEQAIAHPNWSMGKKISVDSASMMNKALEIIEAHYLFDMPPEKIDVLIHPQSTIHSMVSYVDGSILSQMGASDMRTPIAYALGWPARIDSHGKKLDLTQLKTLTFEQADFDRFPALRLAYLCLEKGQGACITFNAANEVAVEAFLAHQIAFGDIIGTIQNALETLESEYTNKELKTVEQIEELDNTVRLATRTYLTALRTK